MPFINNPDAVSSRLIDTATQTDQAQTPVPQEEPGFTEALGASLIRDTSIGSAARAISYKIDDLGALFDEDKFQERFTISEEEARTNYLEKAEAEGFSEDQIDLFLDVDNNASYARVKQRLADEAMVAQTIADAGAKGFVASMAAQILDPINWIPFGASVNAVRLAGGGAKQAAIATGKTGLLSSTAQELVLQGTQLSREGNESAINIGAATALGAMLGSFGLSVSKAFGNRAGEVIAKADEHLNGPEVLDVNDNPQVFYDRSRSLSSASPLSAPEDEVILVDGNIVRQESFKATKQAARKLSPLVSLLDSEFVESRRAVQGLTLNPLYMKKNLDVASEDNVFNNVQNWMGREAVVQEDFKNLYAEYSKRVTQAGEKRLSRKDFNSAIWKASISGDRHPIPEVQKAAQSNRKTLIDPAKEALIELKVFEEDVTPNTAASYAMRIFKQKKIAANPKQFAKDIRPEIQKLLHQSVKGQENIINNPESSQKAIDEARERLSILSDEDAYIDEVTNNVINKISGIDQLTGFSGIQVTERGPLKGRTLDIPDEVLEPWLETDMPNIIGRFARITGPEIELRRKYGTATFNIADENHPILSEIKAEFQAKRAAAKTEKEAIALDKAFRRDVENLQSIWDQVRGTYRSLDLAPDNVFRRAAETTKTLAFMTMLGKVVISSIADPVIMGASQGYGRLLKNSLKVAASKNIRNLTKKEAIRLNKVMNLANNSRLVQTFGITDPYAYGTGFERGLSKSSGIFARFTGINHWNDFWETTSVLLNGERIIDNSLDFVSKGKLSKAEELYMNSLGLDKDARNKIVNEINRLGITKKDINRLRTEEWQDQTLADKVRAAINKQVSQEVIVKTPGDAPKFTETTTGGTMAQFFGFGFAANNKLALKGMQWTDKNFLAMMTNFMLAGTLAYMVKMIATGKEIPEDNGKLFYEALSHNPYLTLPMMMNNYLDAAGFGLQQALTDEDFSSGKNFAKTLTGASGSYIASGIDALGSLKRLSNGQEPTAAQIKAARRLIPGNNLFYIEALTRDAEKKLNNKHGRD